MLNRKPVITCAVTRCGDTAGRRPDPPKSPAGIATAAIVEAMGAALQPPAEACIAPGLSAS